MIDDRCRPNVHPLMIVHPIAAVPREEKKLSPAAAGIGVYPYFENHRSTLVRAEKSRWSRRDLVRRRAPASGRGVTFMSLCSPGSVILRMLAGNVGLQFAAWHTTAGQGNVCRDACAARCWRALLARRIMRTRRFPAQAIVRVRYRLADERTSRGRPALATPE